MKKPKVIVAAAKKAGILIVPALCQRCGRKTQLQAHHPNYDELLKVRFLCKKCHCQEDKERTSQNPVAVISAEVDPSVKEGFKEWWKANNYATEAEAIRALVREKNQEINGRAIE